MAQIVTLDGPAGAGKSTVARRVARRLGAFYLDTGALYRALAFVLDRSGVPAEETETLRKELKQLDVALRDGRVSVNGEDISGHIRTPYVDTIVSPYAALPSLRERLLELQRRQALEGALVAEGRDMGTVVFPDADVKIFLTASAEERARRRWKEQTDRGDDTDYYRVLEDVRRRDDYDTGREHAPLRAAGDAREVPTDGRSIDEVVDVILAIAREPGRGGG